MIYSSLKRRKNSQNSHKSAGSFSTINKWLKDALSNPATLNINNIVLLYPDNSLFYIEKLAKTYQLNDKFIDAATCFKELVRLRGAQRDDLMNLSVVLFKAGEMTDSLTYARMAFDKDSTNTITTKVFIECLISTNQPQEALSLALERLQKSPNDEDYKVAVAQSKRLMGDWDGAVEILGELYRQTKETRFAILMADALGETDSGKALPFYEEALSKGGNFSPIFNYNLSLHYLRTRQFKEGWRLYEYGLDREIGLFGRKVPYNLKGTYRVDLVLNPDPDNWTIVCTEQGIGDQLICLSTLQEAKKDFPKLILVCERRMASIIQRSFPDIQLITNGKIGDENFNETGQNQGYMPMCSMLAKYRPNTESFIANRKPFISVDGDLFYHYLDRLKNIANGRKIIGISWLSHVTANNSKIKSINFSDWLVIFKKDTLIVNLQYGDTTAEQNLVISHGLDMVSFNDLDFTKDLEHWLAIAAACDGITCISTSLVHFAGACGQKVAVVMPYSQGHWSVGVSDTESIIYPSVHIFRHENNETNSSLIQRATNHITKEMK